MAGKRGRPKGNKNGSSNSRGKRGRKAIFTEAQKKILERMIRTSLKTELKTLVRAL